MSTEVEGSISTAPIIPPIETTNINPIVDTAVSSVPTATLSHLNQYPIFVGAKVSAIGCTLVGPIVDRVKPALVWIATTQPVRFVYEQTDMIGDGVLDQVDKFVPGLKSFELKDITGKLTIPVKAAANTVNQTLVEAEESVQRNLVSPVQNNLVQPVVKSANDLKVKVDKSVHETKTKVVSQADPVVRPFNNSLEKYITQYFPQTKKVSKNEYPTELARTMHMVGNVVSRNQELVSIDVIPESEVASELQDDIQAELSVESQLPEIV